MGSSIIEAQAVVFVTAMNDSKADKSPETDKPCAIEASKKRERGA